MEVVFYIFVVFILLGNIHGKIEPRMYDLTHEYSNATIAWPTERRFKFKLTNIERFYDSKTSEYYEGNRFCTAEHGGTHMDAPLHFMKGGNGISDIPIQELIGEAFVIDVSEHAQNNPDLLITANHIQAAEGFYGAIPENGFVMLYTGWSDKWPNVQAYLGTDSTNISLLHFPGLHSEAAQWLVTERKVRAIGIDTASIDYGQSTAYEAHTILMRASIPVLENVKDIKLILDKSVTIYALPMKIKNGSGAPVRIIAIENKTNDSSRIKINIYIFVFTMLSLYILS